MIREMPATSRDLNTITVTADLAIVGGGFAGTCAAITAARAGLRAVLIHDRPVLGGNSSSEVRLWVLGATCHMGSPNRWAREGGVVDELLVENMYRNPEGNALIYDLVLLEKVAAEPNITLLLNTAAFEVAKSDPDTIEAVRAYCSQNSTMYEVRAPLFCDASGDGVVGFLSGAAFRMGAEATAEFGEKFAPTKEYGELLGHSMYFYSKDVGRPVQFIAPSFAMKDITKIPRYRQFNARDHGCRLWWIEWGGRLDTIHDSEKIKWELWRVVYGVWDYIKNSGKFPEAANLTLEWVNHIPGKRESRRFEGDYLLRQQDVVEQRHHADAVAFGGWALDLHPADGVFSDKPGCTHWRMRGTYQIPYRCLYSRNIRNLFLAGRIISVTHAAFGSTRVMGTLAHAAQAVALAAVLCRRHNLLPAQITDRIGELQLELLRRGQHIPQDRLEDPIDLARQATVTASSEFHLRQLPPGGPVVRLDKSWAQMLPVAAGRAPQVTFLVDVDEPTTLQLELRTSQRTDNHTADVILATKTVTLPADKNQPVVADFDAMIDQPLYAFYCLLQNPKVSVHTSEQRLTGVLSVIRAYKQAPTEDVGVESFEVWCPQRRPGGQNLAVIVEPPLKCFTAANITNGLHRPTSAPNAWLAALDDALPKVTLRWSKPQSISRVELFFDTDYDHPMESVLMGHPERAMPFCVKHYRLRDGQGTLLAETTDNHQTRNTITFERRVTTDQIVIECVASHSPVPAAIFAVQCY